MKWIQPVPANERSSPNRPPNDWPIYRLLTGPDDAAFCERVSELPELGYVLAGSPALTFDGQRVIAAQAVLWSGAPGR